MSDRFDNLSLDQLREALSEARAEETAVERALAARLEAACPVQIDGIYRVKLETDTIWQRKLAGRVVLVGYVKAQRCGIGNDAPVELRVSVRPKLVGKKNTPTADGFGRKHHWIDPDRLEPLTQEK
ncbi:MAG: hypothetical protein WAN65_08445 [Candidatus Sulfotelmatobacter sp.]